ncbi:MAG: hypothetical protein ACLU8W_12885 [Clostridia bacterium]
MKKKLISSVLACAFCLAALPVGAMAAEADYASFEEGLAEKDPILYISDKADWDAFVVKSAQVSADQRVQLTTNLNLEGASYQAIQFEGDFDGGNNTISNATFTPNGENCGMFAKISVDQKIANLTLENISAKGNVLTTTYSGVLAGQVYGGDGHRATTLVQNVHVIGGSATGRTAAGVVGYTFLNTMRYCSADGVSVTGLANAGGITGLTYGDIISCYTDNLSLTALQARGRGGITGKLLESGSIVNCWYTYEAIYGEEQLPGEVDGNFYLNKESDVKVQYLGARDWAATQSGWTVTLEDDAVVISYAIDTTYEFV